MLRRSFEEIRLVKLVKSTVRADSNATCKVIDFLEQTSENRGNISVELPFADFSRHADIVVVGEELWGVEIKSAVDNVRKAPQQLNDYRQCFDRSILATSKKQIDQIRSELSSDVGLIEIYLDGAKWVRKPKLRKRKNKYFLASWLSKGDLSALAMKHSIDLDRFTTTSVHDLREKTAKSIPTSSLREYCVSFLRELTKASYVRYTEEKGKICVTDDLETLRFRRNVQSISFNN